MTRAWQDRLRVGLSLVGLAVLLACLLGPAMQDAARAVDDYEAKQARTEVSADTIRVVQFVAQSLGLPAEQVEFDLKAEEPTAYARHDKVYVSPELARNPMLLAFVMAHEFAHIKLGHTQDVSKTHWSARWSRWTGQAANPAHEQERKADEIAVALVCDSLGYDAEVFARFIEDTPETETHPAGQDRARHIRELGALHLALGKKDVFLGAKPASLEALLPAKDSFAALASPQ